MKREHTYEYAHRMCHPETCSCHKDWRIRNPDGVTVAWADTEKEAKIKAEGLNKK